MYFFLKIIFGLDKEKNNKYDFKPFITSFSYILQHINFKAQTFKQFRVLFSFISTTIPEQAKLNLLHYSESQINEYIARVF